MTANLFQAEPDANLLPCDGEVFYHGPVLPPEEADGFFDSLFRGTPWKSDEVMMFGRRIVTARQTAWYGDPDCGYTYSGVMRHPLAWTSVLRELKDSVERLSGASFNSCLLNLYHHGGEGMSWHSDDEKDLVRDAAIASLSLGAERIFRLKHKRLPHSVSVTLEHGSLLVMKGATQTHWLHSVPKTTKVTAPRINLTFRAVDPR